MTVPRKANRRVNYRPASELEGKLLYELRRGITLREALLDEFRIPEELTPERRLELLKEHFLGEEAGT